MIIRNDQLKNSWQSGQGNKRNRFQTEFYLKSGGLHDTENTIFQKKMDLRSSNPGDKKTRAHDVVCDVMYTYMILYMMSYIAYNILTSSYDIICKSCDVYQKVMMSYMTS